MIYANDPAFGKQRRHPKRDQPSSSADIKNAIRRVQFSELYHSHSDRCTQTLREAIELCCDSIITRRIYFLEIHKRWPIMEKLQTKRRNETNHELESQTPFARKPPQGAVDRSAKISDNWRL